MTGRHAVALIAFALLVTKSAPGAEPPTPPASSASGAEPVEAARAHFSRGLELYAAQDYRAALGEFEAAFKIAPSYRLRYNMALCHQALGDYVEAVHQYERHLAEGGDQIAAAERERLQGEMTALREHVGQVTIKANVTDADVMIDSKTVGKLSAEPLFVNAGKHKFWVTKPDYYPASRELVVEGSQSTELLMELRALPRQHAPSVASRLFSSTAGRIGLFVLPIGVLAVVAALLRRRQAPAAISALTPGDVPFDVPANATPEVMPTQEHAVPIVFDEAGASPSSSPARLSVSAAVASDIGRVKPTNQDSYLFKNKLGLYVVADGIGGNAGGGVASATAVQAIDHCFASGPAERIGQLTHLPKPAGELAAAVFAANGAIRKRQKVDWNISEMGTTCIAARFSENGSELYIAHIGDSRVYRLRAGTLVQVTTDHTMGQLGMVGPRANHLSRALGSDPCPRIDVILARPMPDDVYLLCSDGLPKMITAEQITRILGDSSSHSGSANNAVRSLVALANEQGGQDNITAIVIRVSR